jgi:ribosomal 50S subunit-associated protein YjgA (DUF615 family)
LWSAGIIEELRRNLVEDGIAPEAVKRLLAAMRAAFPTAEVEGLRSVDRRADR